MRLDYGRDEILAEHGYERPLVLLFPPLGLGLFGMAVVMGIWGLIDTFFHRAPAKPR